MKTKTYSTIDRSSWPSGPWDGEPDKIQWPDAATGLPCLAVRNPTYGHWCGYVGLPPGHPLHGVDTDDIDNIVSGVHGGINYTDLCFRTQDAEESVGICHVPSPGEPEHVWWVGFDCAHALDASPFTVRNMRDLMLQPVLPATYRTLAYVQDNCASLAAQLAAGVPICVAGV